MVRPVPVADELSAPFWEAAARHELVVQRCVECGNHQHPPRVYCVRCFAERLEFVHVAGRARVYTYTRVVEGDVAEFDPPYTVIVAELEEQRGLWMLSTCAGDQVVSIGDELEVVFDDVAPGVVLPHLLPPGVLPAGVALSAASTPGADAPAEEPRATRAAEEVV